MAPPSSPDGPLPPRMACGYPSVSVATPPMTPKQQQQQQLPPAPPATPAAEAASGGDARDRELTDGGTCVAATGAATAAATALPTAAAGAACGTSVGDGDGSVGGGEVATVAENAPKREDTSAADEAIAPRQTLTTTAAHASDPGLAPLAPTSGAADASGAGAASSKPPPPVFSIAELLTPWPVGSVPIKIKPTRPSTAPTGQAQRKQGARGGGVYTQRPKVSPPDSQASRRQILRRSQHPARPAGVPKSGVPTSGVPTSGVPTSGVPTNSAPAAGSVGVSTVGQVDPRRPTPGQTPSPADLAPRPPPPTPSPQPPAGAGGGTANKAPHRPAPGCSMGAMHVLHAAMSASCGSLGRGCGASSSGGRSWGCHPSQDMRGRDLYIGSPPRQAAAGGARCSAVQSSAFEDAVTAAPTLAAAPRAPTHRLAPSHRSAPSIRYRRPAWERPLAVTPPYANQPFPTDIRHEVTPPLATVEETLHGTGGENGACFAIAPRRANVSADATQNEASHGPGMQVTIVRRPSHER